MKVRRTIRSATAWLLSAVMMLGSMPLALAEDVTTPDEADACAHENTTMEYLQYNARDYRNSGDGVHHTYVYDLVTTTICQSCSSIVDQTEETGLEGYGEHEGDPCDQCNYSAGCRHENAAVTTQERTTQYELDPNNPEKHYEIHIRYYDVYEVTTCPDCGYTSEVNVGSSYGPQEHVGDPCSLCGYAQNTPSPDVTPSPKDTPMPDATPCPHSSWHTETEDTGVSFEWVDARNDRYVCTRVEEKICDICGEMFERTETSYRGEPEAHVWNNSGRCYKCFEFCEHTSAYISYYDENVQYTPGEGGTHTKTYVRMAQKECPDCGMEWEPELEADNQSVTEKHTYGSDGLCQYCGAAEAGCEHTNVSVYEYQVNHQYSADDNSTHTVTYDVMRASTCRDCGLSLGEEQVITGKTRTERHSWSNDGVCGECSARNSCEHARMMTYEGDTIESWTDNGDGTHTVTYTLMRQKHCPDCNMWFAMETVDSGLTREESHSWSSEGICYQCRVENDCEHRNVEINEYKRHMSASDNGDGTHTTTYNIERERHCLDCGQHYASEVIAAGQTCVENHSFSSQDRCWACGAENRCAHEHTEASPRMDNAVYVNNGDGTHTVTYDEGTQTHCLDCDIWFDTVYTRKDVQRTEKHSWDREGLCWPCGATNTCAHEHTQKLYTEHNVDCVDNGDGTHTFTYDLGTQLHCRDCDQWFPVEWTKTGLTRWESHSWYGDNKLCSFCNAENTCSHEHTFSEEITANEGATDNGDGTHLATYNVGYQTHCEDCGWTSEAVWTGNGLTRTERHNFNVDGECSDCRAKNLCQHLNQGTNEWENTYQGIDNGDGTHTRLCDRGYEIYCQDCGVWLDSVTTEYDVSITDEHSWTMEGLCWACGIPNPCAHENRRVETVIGGLITYTDNGNGTHTMCFDQGQQEFCRNCRQQVSDVEWTELGATRIENHYWDEEGNCRACGAVNTCAHGNTHEDIYENERLYEDNDDGTHTVTYDRVKEVYCRDCHTTVSRETLETGLTRTAKHGWNNDGICWGCGAENTCTHANTETVEFGRDQVFEDNGDNTHKVTFERGTQEHCLDCDQWFEVVWTGEIVTEYKPHNWEDEGICWHCGAKNTCPHEHVEEIDYWRYDDDTVVTDNGDGKTHTITAMTTIDYVCSDCNMWLGDEEKGIKTWSDVHEYVEGGAFCDYCGFVNPCTHSAMAPEEIWENVEWTDNNDGKTHTVTYELWTVDTCPDCGWMDWDTETYAKDCTEVQEHWYENGRCPGCLADAPEETPTPVKTETPTPIPTATPTPAPAQTSAPSGGGNGGGNGGTTTVTQPDADEEFIATPEPAATAAPEMVSTLLDTVAQAEAEGSEVSVEVVGAQEVFSETEYEQLKTLPAQEQMLVTLASIGLEDVVQAAIASMDVTLSSEAEALTAQVAERFAAMDEEERAQVEEKLTQLFPKTEMTIGGVTYEYFVIDLQIVVDGKVRVERYGFRYDEELGQWVFEKLDLVDMYVEAA